MLTAISNVRTSKRALATAVASIILQMVLAAIGPVTLVFQTILLTLVVLSTAALGDERGRFDIRQPWAVLMIFHIPFWVIGTFNTVIAKGMDSNWTFEKVGHLPTALLIVSTGFLFIGIGYRMGLRVYANRARHDKPYPWDCSRLLPLTVAIYVLVWLVRYSHGESLQAATFSMLLEQSPLPAYVRALSGPIPLFLILVVWGAHYSNPNRRDIYRLALFISVGELVWAVIIGTSKSLFVLPIFLPIIPYIIFNRSIPIRRLVISVAVLLLIAYPYASALRAVYFTSDGPTRSVARELAFQQSSPWSSFNSELVGDYAAQAIERSGGIGALNELLRLDEEGKLNIGGEFYWRAIVGLIPRLIWPDKPILLEGAYFSAYLQGMTGSISDIDPDVNSGSISGSVAPTLFGSFYWNFGWPGVLITSFVLGFFSGRVFSYLKRRNNLSDPASFLYYISILSLLDTTESEVVKFPSSLVWSIAVAWVIIRALGWHKKPTGQTSAALQ